ncbi:unnamed protein product [Mucor hiemalis]
MGLQDVLLAVDVGRLTSGLQKINTTKALPIISTAAALLYTSYQLSSYWKSKNSKYKVIPMPTKGYYPIIGHLLSLESEPHLERSLAKWHKETGPIIKLQFGVQSWVFIADATLAHKIFVTNGTKSSGRPIFVFRHNYYSHGKGAVFPQPDADWRKARTTVLALVAPNKIDERAEVYRLESIALVERILRKIDNGEAEFYPKMDIQLAVFNISLQICLGKRYDSYEDEEFKAIYRLVDEHFEFEDISFELPNFFPAIYTPLHSMLHKSKMEAWEERFVKVVSSHLEEARAKEDVNLVKIAPEMPERDLLVLIADVLAAVADTSFHSLLNIIKLITTYPDVQIKAASEIASFVSINGRLPRFDEREQLPYCVCVLKESMRFRPPLAFGVPHIASEDIEVDGYLIPKGTVLLPSNVVMQRDSALHPDEPEKFKPERYMKDLKTMHASANGKTEERDHFSFGWGRRRCPGPYLAEMNIFFVFTALLAKISVEPASSGLPDLDADKKVPFSVKFSKRPGDISFS